MLRVIGTKYLKAREMALVMKFFSDVVIIKAGWKCLV